VGGEVTELPAPSEANRGYTYKVVTAGTYQGIAAKVGDTFISYATRWDLVPSGDEPSVIVDDELSTTSENPVQNKVITNAMVGEKTAGKQFVIDGQTVTAADGAEIFNVYTGNYQNKATGQASHAEGTETIATAHSSHAEGAGTMATGNQSHAEGASTQAIGQGSHAEGVGAQAIGQGSHAEGMGTKATVNYAHAEGFNTTASGSGSHAEGTRTTASGGSCHAEGSGTTATWSDSHAEGSGTTASGGASHAEGEGTTASNSGSHAEGGGTTASGLYSHAEGESTIAASSYQHTQGKFNVADANNTYAFIIGNGTADNARHNAFAIDWNGNIYVNNSATGVNVETLSSILNPISESEYEAIATKDKPLYFIYD